MAEIPERVKALLEDYTAAVEQALPGLMAACYLHGSIALDAFVPGQSDVDMITVISRCTSEDIERLAALHRDLW